MSAAESAPAVSRPEGGWRDGDWIVKIAPGSLNPRGFVQTRGTDGWSSFSDYIVDGWIKDGLVVYVNAPREPEPVMEPLPTEPSAIRATVRGVEEKVTLLVGPDSGDAWWDFDGRVADPGRITAWEPLKTRAEWEAEQDGDTVRVPKEAVDRLRHYDLRKPLYIADQLGAAIVDFLDAVDAERGDQA